MEETQDIAPAIEDQQGPPQQVDPAEKYYNYLKKAGADAPPTFDSFKKTLSDPKSAQQYYNYLRDKKFDAPPTFDSFSKTLGVSPSTPQTVDTPNQVQAPAPPEHEIQHTSVHDIRHLQEMSNLPIRNESTAMGGLAGSASSYTYSQADADRNKAYKGQYENKAQELGKEWGVDAEAIKKTLTDFPDEPDENKLKNFAVASKQNPVIYSRLKDANDIRMAIVKSGNGGVNDANAFNHLQQADDYHELVDYNIPLQKEIMAKHNLGPQFLEKLKNTQAPLINTLDPDLLAKYWNSQDKELGLNPSQYAGLETERLFSPNKYQMDLNIIKQSRGIGEDGKATPKDLSKESYEYQRGVENVLYNLDRQGRENTARYIAGQKPQIEAQVHDALSMAQVKMNNAKTKEEQESIKQEFNNNPLIQEATKLEQGQDELKYADVNDQRIYPLNFADQATRAVRDAMDLDKDSMFNVKDLSAILQGAGESSDNTIRWIKNMAINIAGSDEQKSFNNAKNIGHQSLTDLSAYEPRSYTGVESPFKIPDNLTKQVQSIFNDSALSSSEKEQKATALVRGNFDQLEVNPKAGQQNITGKSALFQAANVMGQILGVANQSFLLGGAIGDASKLQQMATAFTPMFMSTQNQMYEQALKNGDEHPLLKSNLDATIISLASLINPDIKVVRGMMGAESGLGKTISGISEDTWNKVLSENKPIVDRALGVAKATGKQMGLANLQYGLIVPTAEAISHKAIFNEDSNLGDKIKDAVIQTSITMALPAILHGAWRGMKAKDVNPTQKYAIVEAGLHPDLNIELIEGRIKAGEISEIQGHEMKQMVKHAGEILQNAEMIKTDGTPMNEKEVADTVYNMLRVRTLEGKLKNAAGPVKPIIEERIHELNKDIADLHTSEESKQKTELNQLLHDNLDRIREKMPTMEGPIKDAIARNEPEEVYREIASQAQETTKVDGVEKSSRSLTEEIFGKALVDKAIEISKKKPEPIPKEESVNEKPTEGAETNNAEVSGAASSISVVRPGELKKPETITIKPQDNASAIRSDQGQGSTTGNEPGRGQNEGGENIPVNPKETPGNAGPIEQAGQQRGQTPGEEVISDELPFGQGPVGIAHEAQVDRSRAELNVLPPERGEGITLKESIDRGKELLKDGTDVGKIVADFQKDKKVSSDAMATVRAAYNELAGKTNKAYDEFGPESPQAKAAFTEERSFYNNAVKPMQTEWSKIGVAQQGAIDIDTGTITGLRRAYNEASGKDFTAAQEKTAKELSDKVKELTDREKGLQDKIDKLMKDKESKATPEENIKESAKKLAKKIRDNAKLNKPGMFSAATPASLVWDSAVEIVAKSVEVGGDLAQAIVDGVAHIKGSDWYKGLSDTDKNKAEQQFTQWHQNADKDFSSLAEKFANKKGNKFTAEEAKDVWNHTKENYIDKGSPLNDAIKGTSNDLGLTSEQILHAIATPKGSREATLELFKTQYERRKAMNAAKRFVANADKSGWYKFWDNLPNAFFNLKTYGHGTVGFLTHAGPNLFRPSVWKAYWPNFINQFKFAYGNTGKYEMAITKLKNSPNFDAWNQAGLAVDPSMAYDQYQNFTPPKTKAGQKLNWLGEAGTRGFNALKFLRYDMAEMFYNKASEAEKADPELRKEIAELVNHATGHTEVKLPKWTNKAFFAPGLEVSRWQRMITDPAMALNTFANWNKKTPAEQAAAKIVAKGAGERFATYATLLAANAGILAATGSKQTINTTDPSKSDWLKFKAGGKTIDFSGGVLSPLRILEGLGVMAYYSGFGDKKDLRTTPQDKAGRTLITQARYKLSPIGGIIAEGAFGTDALGNPTPWSQVKPGPGRHKLNWTEYGTSQLPIPIAAGIKAAIESMQEKGMTNPQINDVMNGLLQFGVEGFTGVKVANDFSLHEEGGSGGGGGAGGSYGRKPAHK